MAELKIISVSVAGLVDDGRERLLLVKRRKDDFGKAQKGWDIILGKAEYGDKKLKETAIREISQESGVRKKDIKIDRAASRLGTVLCAFFNETNRKLILCVRARIPKNHHFRPNKEISDHRMAQTTEGSKKSWGKFVKSEISQDRISHCLESIRQNKPMLMTYRYRNGESPCLEKVAYKKLSVQPLTIAWLHRHGIKNNEYLQIGL